MSKLKTIIKKITDNLWLSSILLLAFGLRIWGVNFGLPYTYHGDEPIFVNRALDMLKTGNLNPGWFDYPSLPFYLLSILFFPLFRWGNLIEVCSGPNNYCYYLLGRCFTAFLSVVSIYFLYKIVKGLLGKRVALISAVFLAFNFANVAHSHYIKNDILLSLISIIILYFAIEIYKNGKLECYLFTGLLIGLANATKYCPHLIIYLLVAHILRQKENKGGIINLKLVYALLSCLVGFFIGSPFLVISQKDLFKVIKFYFEILFTKSNKMIFASSDGGNSNIKFYLLHLYYIWITPLISILALIGVYPTIKRLGKSLSLLVFSFPTLYFFTILGSRLRFDRYIIPLVPFVLIFAAVVGDTAIGFLKTKFGKLGEIFGIILLIFFLVFPISKIIYFDWSISKDERGSRSLAYDWIKENIKNKEGILLSGILQTVGGKLWTLNKDYPLVWEPSLTKEVDYYVARGFKYLVDANYNLSKDYVNVEDYQKVNTIYNNLLDSNLLVKEIYDPKFESLLNISGYEGSAGIMMTHTPHIRVFKFPDFSSTNKTFVKRDEENIKCKDWFVVEDKESLGGKSLMLDKNMGKNLCYFIEILGRGVFDIEIRYKSAVEDGEKIAFEIVRGGTTRIIKNVRLELKENSYQTNKLELNLLEIDPGEFTFQFETISSLVEPFYIDYVLIKRTL